ncbi:MAG: copper transporter [Trueperella sp.]|nr:copper transporter [Trueperella sp.]
MVDFRYHLVSLVSVFLALALGIILGAGPLQDSIGEALSGEVSNLREVNKQIKTTNDELKKRTEQQEAAIGKTAPLLLADTMTGRSVGIIVLPGADDAYVTEAQERLKQTGAAVVGEIHISSAWTYAEDSAYRGSFADQIATYVTGAEPTNDPNTVLAMALNQIAREGIATENNKTLSQLLTGTDTPMLTGIDGFNTGAAGLVIITNDAAAPDPNSEVDASAQAQAEYDATTFAELARTLKGTGPVVVAGAADTDNDVVRLLRDRRSVCSTVDSIDSVVGQINIALALAAEFSGKSVQLGFDAGATSELGDRIEAVQPAEGTE